MTTPAINSTLSTFGAYSNPDSLTAESLLLYCQTQLGSLDTEIQGYMDQQKAALKHKAAIAQIENKMKEYFDAKWDKSKGGVWGNLGSTIDEAIASLPAGDPMRNQLKDFKDQLWDAGKNGLSLDAFKAYADTAHQMLEDVKGNAELNMIQLQSLMSQRQTAVQLTTNMMAKVDQAVLQVVGNLR